MKLPQSVEEEITHRHLTIVGRQPHTISTGTAIFL